jgi:hypothetical protein
MRTGGRFFTGEYGGDPGTSGAAITLYWLGTTTVITLTSTQRVEIINLQLSTTAAARVTVASGTAQGSLTAGSILTDLDLAANGGVALDLDDCPHQMPRGVTPKVYGGASSTVRVVIKGRISGV